MGIKIERKPLLSRLTCNHAYVVFRRNIHGDEINMTNGKRSVWSCCFCGSTRLEPELYTPKENPLYKLL